MMHLDIEDTDGGHSGDFSGFESRGKIPQRTELRAAAIWVRDLSERNMKGF